MLHHRLSRRTGLRTRATQTRRIGIAGLLLCGSGALSVIGLHGAFAQDAAQPAPRAASRIDAPLAVEWKYTGAAFAGNTAAPIVSQDTAYFASGGIVYAVDLTSGAQKWRYPASGSLPRAVLYAPAYSNGVVFLSTSEGLSALDATTGKLKYPSLVVPTGAVTSPVVVGDAVYFGGGGGRVYALNVATGEPTNATFRSGLNLQTDIAGNMTTANGMLYVITANQTLHAIDALTGNQRWQTRIEGETRGAIAVPSGETLYVAAGSALQAYRASSGVMRWAQATPRNIVAPPAVDSDGTAYVVTSDRAVYAIKGQGGGRPVSGWKIAPQVDYNVVAQPVIADDLVVIASQGGGLSAFDRATGALKWNYQVRPSATESSNLPYRAGISASPVTSGDTLYALSDDGTLTAFRHDAEDVTPPVVTPIRPTQGDYINGQPPFTFRARVVDEGSGLNLDTLSMQIDDNQIPRQRILGVGKNGFLFDDVSSEVTYTILPRAANEVGRTTALGDGHHIVTITVKDWMGNTATRSWGFTVDDTIRRGGGPAAGGGRPGVGGGGGKSGE